MDGTTQPQAAAAAPAQSHPASKPGKKTGGARWALLVFGTFGLLIAGVAGMQYFRAEPGQAADAAKAPAPPAAPKRFPAVARVGKAEVTYEMLAAECISRHGKEVLDDLINRMVIQQACEEAGIEVTEDEVTAEVSRIAKKFNLEPSAWYQMLQSERNISQAQYRQSVVWPMLALKKLAGEQIDITEEEIEQAFVRNYGPRVKARMIMIDNLRRAQECWNKCSEDPDNFEKFAQEYSIDPTSRALGGTVPPIPRFSGSPEIEKAAFKLKEGEISALVQVQPNSFVILKCEGRTEPVVTDIEEVKTTLYDELFEQKTQQSVAKVFSKVREETRIDNYLTKSSTGGSLTQPAGGQIQQTSGTAPAGTVRIGNREAAGKVTLEE